MFETWGGEVLENYKNYSQDRNKEEECLCILSSKKYKYPYTTSDQSSLVSQVNGWVTRLIFTLCIGHTLHVPWKCLWASFQIVPNFMVLCTDGISSSHWFAINPAFSVYSQQATPWIIMPTIECNSKHFKLSSKVFKYNLLYNFSCSTVMKKQRRGSF